MADYQGIVDAMHGILAAGADHAEDRIAALHGEYTEGVEEVNVRLQTCGELLRRGQRAEALRQSDAEPNLMEAVAVLDSLEREKWIERSDHCRLGRPSRLNIDVAGELNEAYAVEEPLAALMRAHRWLALDRAALPPRIEVLRRIRQADAGNAVWDEDLREYERARANQIVSEVEAAEQRRDLPSLAKLEQEVRSQDWLQPLPRRVVERVIRAHRSLKHVKARNNLVGLGEELIQAFSELNLRQGRTLREKWTADAPSGLTGNDDELLEVVAPAMEWLKSEDEKEKTAREFRGAVASLENCLDDGAGWNDLRRVYDTVKRFDQILDPMLENRVAEQFRYLETAATRRNRLIMVGVSFSLVALAVLVGYLIVGYTRSVQIRELAVQVKSLIDQDHYTQAENLIKNIETDRPWIGRSSMIRKLKEDLRSAVDRDRQRVALFEQLIAGVETRGVTNADFDSFSETLAQLEKAETLAEELAKSHPELPTQAAEVRSRVVQTSNAMQAAADDEFNKDLTSLQDRIEKLDRQDLSAIDELLAACESVLDTPRVSATTREALLPRMIERLRTDRKSVLDARNKEDALGNITGGVGSESFFGSMLESYCREFPQTVRSRHFDRVLKKEIPLWTGIGEWDKLVRAVAALDLMTLSCNDAKSLSVKVNELSSKYEGLPPPPGVDEIKVHLEAITDRVDDDGERIHLQLLETFRYPYSSAIFMVQTKTGRTYYFQEKPLLTADKIRFPVLKGFDPNEAEYEWFPREEIANQPAGESFDWTSPQAAFSTLALTRIQGLTDAEWNQKFYELVATLCEDKQMEPILKLQFLQKLLGIACQGSYCLRKAFGAHNEVLQNADLDWNPNWVDPNDSDGQKARDIAKSILDRLPPIERVADEIRQMRVEIQPVGDGSHYVWVGWLCCRADDEWTCEASRDKLQQRSGELFVLHVAEDGGGVDFRTIGTLRGGRVLMVPQPDESFVEGRAVFVVPDNNDSG